MSWSAVMAALVTGRPPILVLTPAMRVKEGKK